MMAFFTHQVLQIVPCYCNSTKFKFKFKPNQSNCKTKASLQTIPPPQSSFSDQFVLQLADSFEDSVSSSSSPLPLQKLRDTSSQTLLATQWPSRKDEAFRFTDVSFIRRSQIKPVLHAPDGSFLSDIPPDSGFANIVIADGFVFDSLCDRADLPDGVYVGSLSGLSSERIGERVFQFLGDFQWGDMFWSINGVGAPDLMVIYVPEGCRVEKPIHLRYLSFDTGNKESKELPVSNPRVFVLAEKGAEVGIVEEFVGSEGSERYWANSVLEVVIGEGAKVRHSYIQNQSSNSAHVKWTTVRQESASEYKLAEVSTGGKLGRHNLHVQQFGPDTNTELVTLHLSVADQTQDLHSRIVLDHPRGRSQQLHKCIVAHSSGQAVFDGNVKVNRYAQQTDAGQLTRSLLLEPRATVNVKPNLQIIADDVKCSHGAAISDLEERQLFYFQARGIDAETARKALVISFAAEVINHIPHASIQEELKHRVRELLDSRQQSVAIGTLDCS